MYEDILRSTDHREFPLPEGPWMMMQKWDHLLFMHWPASTQVMKSYLPPGLELDLYGGEAWISIISFKVSQVGLRNMPRIPFLRSYLEVNVRTYVKRNGISGVYFFSLDANNLFAVLGARVATLPYFYAKMEMKKNGEYFDYYSARKGKEGAIFKGSYQPIGRPSSPEKGSLSHWLLERYCFWSAKGDSLFRGDIHHEKWGIQHAKVSMEKQSMISFLPDNSIGEGPLINYASSKMVLNWMIQKEREGGRWGHSML